MYFYRVKLARGKMFMSVPGKGPQRSHLGKTSGASQTQRPPGRLPKRQNLLRPNRYSSHHSGTVYGVGFVPVRQRRGL